MSKRTAAAALTWAVLVILFGGATPTRFVSVLAACNSGCSTDAECGEGATCCGGSCCGKRCCGDAQNGTCTDLKDDDNCDGCGVRCNDGSSGCLFVSHCVRLPPCTSDAGLGWFCSNYGEYGCSLL